MQNAPKLTIQQCRISKFSGLGPEPPASNLYTLEPAMIDIYAKFEASSFVYSQDKDGDPKFRK